MANGIIRQNQTKAELAQYLSTSCFTPALSTLMIAICRKHLLPWPGLTIRLMAKHLPKSIATAEGHLGQEAKKLQSTSIDKDIEPDQELDNERTHAILCTIID